MYKLLTRVLLCSFLCSHSVYATEVAASNDPSTCPQVSFSEIFTDPNNIELNYCYLLQKIKSGDLKSAIPVVERILLLDPYEAQARVIYASLLYHTDMMSDAKREFEDVRQRRLPVSDEELVMDYLRRIDELGKRANHSVEVSIGGHFDNNRNAAPEKDVLLFYGFEYPYKIDEVDDYGTYTSLTYDLNYHFGEYRNHDVLASLEYSRDNQAFYDTQDFMSVNGSLGARIDINGTNVTTLAYHSLHRLHGESFLRSSGARLGLDKHWNLRDHDLTLYASATGGYFKDTYIDSDTSPSASSSSGERTFARASGSITFGSSHRLSLAAGYTYKNADPLTFEYRSWNTSLGHLWMFKNGQRLSTYINGGHLTYAATDEFVTGDPTQERQDTPVQVMTTFTTPVGWFFDVVGLTSDNKPISKSNAFKNFTLALSGEYQSNHSDIPNFDSNNVRWQAMFRKRFEF
jgi:hypothetical protein